MNIKLNYNKNIHSNKFPIVIEDVCVCMYDCVHTVNQQLLQHISIAINSIPITVCTKYFNIHQLIKLY